MEHAIGDRGSYLVKTTFWILVPSKITYAAAVTNTLTWQEDINESTDNR